MTPSARRVPALISQRHYAPSRNASNAPEDNPVLAAYEQRKRERAAELERNRETDIDDAEEGVHQVGTGFLAPNSIFLDPVADRPLDSTAKGVSLGHVTSPSRAQRLDPMPHRRRRWERKMAIREVKRRGRLTKTELIRRTERSYRAKSEYIKTSMKKLSPLANQIAGKSIEDAITQMQFSKKKNAIPVRNHLEQARDEAVVQRGMGLGQAEGQTGPRVIIKTKNGEKLKISDRTSLYIDQAWVNKGQYGQDKNKRARGRIDRLQLPTTAITVLLKEEATRVREHMERVARARSKKVWTQLPDRPLVEQRQYYSW